MNIYIRAIYLPIKNSDFEGSVDFLPLDTEDLKKPDIPLKRWMEGKFTREEKNIASSRTVLKRIKEIKENIDSGERYKFDVTIEGKESTFEEVLKILNI